MKRALTGLAAVLLLCSLAARPAAAREIGPGENWCGAIAALSPGEELVLRPGDYEGPCTIRNGGAPGAPLVIRAASLEQRPRIVYTDTRTNVINVRADHVTIRGLRLGPSDGYVDGVRIYGGRDVTVEDCEFVGIAGIAIVANHTSLRELTVRRNVILDSKATAMYFGCHDGVACEVDDIVIEGNHLERVALRGAEGVGYGIQLKLNSTGVIRGNTIIDTKGPAIMVYGARSPDRVSIVERNFVAGSRESSGIVVGGGPAIVRNNIAVGSIEAGIAVEDYQRRGLLRGVVVAHNTAYGNEHAGIRVAATAQDVTIANNAVHARAAALPSPRSGLVLGGNVDCSSSPNACFADARARDFSPGSLLAGLGHRWTEAWAPVQDFFGTRRSPAPAVGAVERASGRVPTSVGTP